MKGASTYLSITISNKLKVQAIFLSQIVIKSTFILNTPIIFLVNILHLHTFVFYCPMF